MTPIALLSALATSSNFLAGVAREQDADGEENRSKSHTRNGTRGLLTFRYGGNQYYEGADHIQVPRLTHGLRVIPCLHTTALAVAGV